LYIALEPVVSIKLPAPPPITPYPWVGDFVSVTMGKLNVKEELDVSELPIIEVTLVVVLPLASSVGGNQ
jgi:hypothetical protein